MNDSSNTPGITSTSDEKPSQDTAHAPQGPVQGLKPTGTNNPQQGPSKAPPPPVQAAQGTPLHAQTPTPAQGPTAEQQVDTSDDQSPEATVATPEPTPNRRDQENKKLLALRDLSDDEVNGLELHQLLKAKARALGICEEDDTSDLTIAERSQLTYLIHIDTAVSVDHIPYQVFLQKVWCLGPSERLAKLVHDLTGFSHYRYGSDHFQTLADGENPASPELKDGE